jgi:hypothetical protein
VPHYVPGMDETQTLAVPALRESARLARPRLTHAIMADRAVVAAAEIAMLKQKLAAAEARIRIEADKNNGFKPFTWWKSNKTKSTPPLDELRECVAALNCEIAKRSGF